MKLNAVWVGSEEPEKLAEFYKKVFNDWDWHEGQWWQFDMGDGSKFVVGPHAANWKHHEHATPGHTMVVAQTHDVHEMVKKLKDWGAHVVAEPWQPDEHESPHAWVATVADPDGNFFHIATPWEHSDAHWWSNWWTKWWDNWSTSTAE